MPRLGFLMAVLLAVPAFMAPALLAVAAGSVQAAPPCRDEAERLCAAVTPGGGRKLDCLRAYEPQLGSACRAALPRLQACSDEVRRLCGDGAPMAVEFCAQRRRAALKPVCGDLGV